MQTAKQTVKQTVKLSDLKKQKAEYKRKQAANTIRLADLEKRKAEYKAKLAEEAAAQNDPVAKIERQISEARAGYAGNIKNAISRAAEQKAAQIAADRDAEYAPREVSAAVQEKIQAIGVSSRLKKGTELYRHQAKLRDEYMNAATHNEQAAAKAKLDDFAAKLPGKGLERAASAIGGGIVSLEAGVAKMLNPTAKGGGADRVLENVEKANITGKAGLGSVGGLMYDAVQTATNNVAAIGVGAATAGAVNPLALMGASAAGSSVREAQQAGANDKIAVAAGTINGILEAAFEKVPLDNLFKLARGANADKLIKDGLKGYALAVARQAGLEGTSEAATTVAQNFANRMVYEKSLHPEESWSEWAKDTGNEAAYSFLLGGLVGGTMGAPAAVAGRAKEVSRAQSEAAEKAQTLQNAAEFAAPDTAENARQTQNKALQAVEAVQGEEVYTGQETNGQSGQNLLAGNLQGAENAVPVKVGKATVIQHPYTGAVPQNVAGKTRQMQSEIKPEVLAEAQETINEARQDGHFAGYIRATLQNIFKRSGGQRAVRIENVQFEGEPYEATVNASITKKLAGDHGMTAEKLAVFEQLDKVLAGAEFVGSSAYGKDNANRAKYVVRYDYFETDINVGGKPYVVAFDVAVHREQNNLRTYKTIEKVSLQPLGADPAPNADATSEPLAATPGPQPGAANGANSLDSYSIQNGAENVKPGAENSAENARQAQNKALQAVEAVQGEEVYTGQETNGQSGQNAFAGNLQGAENAVPENNSWKERYYNEGDRAYLYSRDMQRGYEIPEKTELSYTIDKSGGIKLKTALVPELDTADYKDFAKAYAARNLITEFDSNGNIVNAKPVQIAEDGKKVIITQKGINDVLKNVRGNRKSASLLDSIFVLDDIIARAHKVGEAKNAKGRVNPYSYYEARFTDSAGQEYSVTVNIKDTPETSRYHYHNLQEAEIKIEPFDGTSSDNGTIAGADLIAKGSELTTLSSSQGTDVPAEAAPGEHARNAMGNFDNTANVSINNAGGVVNTGAENADGLDAARKICEKLGVTLRVARLPEGVDGHYANGVITVAPNAESPVNEVFIHELTHHLEQSGGYEQYARFVTQEFERSYGKQALKSYKQQIRELYAEAGEQLSEEGATREMVAECTEDLLADEAMMRRLADFDGGLFSRIANWLSDMAVKLRGTGAQKRAREAARRFEAALREMDSTNTGGKGQYEINPKFAGQLDSWDGKSDRTFELGTTSKALQSIGIDDRRIMLHATKVKKILSKHPGMSMNVIKQVPEILENPIVVLKSQQSASRVAVFGEVQDELGAPVLAVMELQPSGSSGEILDLNIVASAYGKDSNAANFVRKSEVLYIDPNKKRADSWFQGIRLQLPSYKASYGSLGSVTYTGGKVNIEGVPFEDLLNETGGKGQYKINPKFAGQLDSWDGKSDRTFELGTTSKALQSIGIDDRRIMLHATKVKKILSKHPGMSMNVIKQVPEILENPIVVLKSQQSASRVAVFGEVQDELGAPVLAVLELNPYNRGGEVLSLNIVASAYGKDSNAANFVRKSEVLYIDPNKKRADSWFQGLGLQLPSDKASYGSLGSVTYTDGKVNIEGVPFEDLLNETGGKGQYKIARTERGERFVDVEQDILQGREEKDMPRVLADVVRNKFNNLIEVNGQSIGINQKTVKEWQFSKDAQSLYNNDKQTYKDKMRSLNNADELLAAAKSYVNEGLKHPRKDNFVGFARGNVDFKVGENGYSADIVVGIRSTGNAYLYDVVNIKQKKIASALYNQPSRSEPDSNAPATDTSITPVGANVKGKNARKANKTRMLENAKKQQEQYDAEVRELRQAELEDEARDAREEARAKVEAEDVQKGIYAGVDRSFAVRELTRGAVKLYGIPRGRIGEAGAYVEEYARAALERRRGGMNAAPTEELAAFLYDMGGVYDDTAGDNMDVARAMDDYKIFVPADVRENIGGFNAMKRDCRLALRTKTANGSQTRPANRSWARIDDVYEELQEQFGYGMFPELDNRTARLERLIEVREEVEPEFLSWDKLGDKMGVENFEPLQLELNKLVNEFVDRVDKIDREKAAARTDRAKDRKRLQTEAMRLAKERCLGDPETGEPAVDVPQSMAAEMANARYIKDPGAGMSLGNRDLTGGLELVSRHNRALGEWLKGQFVKPLDDAKALYSRMLTEEMGKINEYMAEHGFVKGSAESAAIQRIGEGVRQLGKDELVDFGQKDFDERMARLKQAGEQVQDEGLKKSDPVLWEQIQYLQSPKVRAEAEKRLQKWLADGKRPPDAGETVTYTLADLQREFPERWQEIKDAADFCRGIYDRVFDDIEAAYARIYPNAAKRELERVLQSITSKTLYAEQQRIKAEADELAAARVEVRMEQSRTLAEKYEKQGKKESAARIKRLLKAQESAAKGLRAKANHRRDNAKRAEDIIIHLREEYNKGEKLRQKHIKYRKNYFHHYKEKGWVGREVLDTIMTPAEISSSLAGISEFTKPNSRFRGFLEGRSGHMAYTEDAFGGLQKYLSEAAEAIYIDPVVKDFRQKIAGMAEATADTANANQTILWLTRVTDRLAGKTSAIDRPLQEMTHRKAMKIVKMISGRMRGNAVMYNLGTFFVQWGNWSNIHLMGISGKNQIQGLRDWLECDIAPGSTARQLLAGSNFMRERYMDDVINRMDYAAHWWNKPKKLANFMLQFGDEQVARHIWFSAYRQGQTNKAADPIAYADEITRKCVAGRGIGEMALTQQSELIKLLAPFQVEVANTWNQMKDTTFDSRLSKAERLKRFAFCFAHTAALNLLLWLVTGRKPLASLLDAVIEGAAGWDDDEEQTVAERSVEFAKKLAAEMASYMPFASQALNILVPDEDDRKALLGDTDLTRYGTGNVLMENASALVADIVSGGDVLESGSGLVLSALMPGGASQLKKTLGTAQDLGWLPKVAAGWKDGVKISREKGSYTAGGALRFDIDTANPISVARGLAFGRYATREGQEYINGGAKPTLSKERANAAKEFEAKYGVTMSEYAAIYAAIKDLESDTVDGKKVAAGSKAERAGRGKSKSLKAKEVVDRLTPRAGKAVREKLYAEMDVGKSVW